MPGPSAAPGGPPHEPPDGPARASSVRPAGTRLPGARDGGGPVEIRPLRTAEECRACVHLQLTTWGESYAEVVPGSILQVAQRVGGVAAGAFDERGTLLGFVFGMTGVERATDGSLRPVHWSDTLAVHPDARDRGIGRRLKEHQRETLRRIGVERMYWTFDPLVARNAHLNLSKLGVRVVEYVVDMYDAGTDDDRMFGTDRFVVSWEVQEAATASDPARLTNAAMSAALEAPILNPGLFPDEDAGRSRGTHDARVVRVAVPLDIAALRDRSPAAAARWRSSTRRTFERLLGSGYEIVGFRRDGDANQGYYVLALQSSAGATGRVGEGAVGESPGDRGA